MLVESRSAAHDVLALIDEAVPRLTSTPDQAPRHFAAAGLMRCCALLKSILSLDESGMAGVAGILAGQHWDTWLVALYVLLAGDEGLRGTSGVGGTRRMTSNDLAERIAELSRDDITSGVRSSSDVDPNFAMISAHIKYGRDEWRVTSEASPVRSDVVLTPLLHTVHLARYVFKEFRIDVTRLDLLAAGVKPD